MRALNIIAFVKYRVPVYQPSMSLCAKAGKIVQNEHVQGSVPPILWTCMKQVQRHGDKYKDTVMYDTSTGYGIRYGYKYRVPVQYKYRSTWLVL